MHHETRQILQVRVTRHPTADWTAQQIVDTCDWDRDPPRYLIRDYGEAFDRRLRGLVVRQAPNTRKSTAGERARRALGQMRRQDRVSGSSVYRRRAPSPSWARPACAVRISFDVPVQPDRPDHRAAGARGRASCVSPCCLMVGWSCCALQARGGKHEQASRGRARRAGSRELAGRYRTEALSIARNRPRSSSRITSTVGGSRPSPNQSTVV
jgi:hypothetical protein